MNNTAHIPPRQTSWQAALQTGDDGEQAVATALQKLGFRVEHGPTASSEFDLQAAITLEVKCCPRALLFGRVFVEFSCSGRPSGLSTTKAGAWCFVLPDEILLIRTGVLKTLAASYKRNTYFPEGREVIGVLLPLDVLRRNGFLLEEML